MRGGNIPHPSLITLLSIKGGVKFNEAEEEKSPKASHLTLVGVLKTLVESEEGERREKIKKMKKAKMAETSEKPKEPPIQLCLMRGLVVKREGALKPIQSSQCSPM